MIYNKPSWYHVKPWSRHGLILLTVGLAYVAVGIMFVSQPATELRAENLKLALNVMPYAGWGIGFMVVGLITMISSRWPFAPKSLGYSILSGWTVAWAGFHIIGGIAAGNTAYIASGFVWATMAFLWWAVSGLVSLPEEGNVGGYPSTIGHLAGCAHCGSVCICDTKTGLESEPQDSGGILPLEHGDGSLRSSESLRYRNYYSPERDGGQAAARDRPTP